VFKEKKCLFVMLSVIPHAHAQSFPPTKYSFVVKLSSFSFESEHIMENNITNIIFKKRLCTTRHGMQI